MNFLVILKSNLKRILKKKSFIIISFIIPLAVSLLFGLVLKLGNNISGTAAIINDDKGTLSTEFISQIQKTNKINIYTKEDGLERVKKKLDTVCYEIPENFSELIKRGDKPSIIAHKVESSKETGNFEFNLNSIINTMATQNVLKSNGINISATELNQEGSKIQVINNEKVSTDDVIILNILMSYIFFCAIGIGIELFSLKKQNILERSFSTGNKPWQVIGGILGAMFILYSIIFSSIFLIESAVRSSAMIEKWPVVMLNTTLMVLVALSLGIMASRICKNENMINLVVQMVSYVTCFVGGSFVPFEFLPKTVQHFSKFTPQYWALQSINTGNCALAIIVGLFALVLFTAGTFKTRRFI